MKRSSLLLTGALFFSTLSAAPALASPFTITFSFSGQPATGSGVFLADSTATAGQYLVTAISGTVNGATISQLLDPGAYPVASLPPNDNMLYYPETMDVQFVDEGGVSFEDAMGVDYNIYYGTFISSVEGYQVITGATGLDGGSLDTFSLGMPTPVPTPEPQSLILVGSSLLGVLGMARRRLFR